MPAVRVEPETVTATGRTACSGNPDGGK